MERRSFLFTIPSDISGGLTSAVLMLPESIAFGCLIVAPMGTEFIPLGIIIGLTSLAFLNLGAFPFGKWNIMLNGPFSLSSLMLASIITIMMTKYGISPKKDLELLLFFIFLITFVAGLLQVIFGLLKLGQLTKYIPYPVISGLFNGTAILIVIGQLPVILGHTSGNFLMDLVDNPALIQPYSLFITMVTIIVIAKGERITKKIPAPILGLLTGTLAYYLIKFIIDYKFFGIIEVAETVSWIASANQLGATVGSIPSGLTMLSLDNSPIFFFQNFKGLFFDIGSKHGELLIELLPLTLGIALIISLKSMISLISADNLIDKRSNSNRELIAQGVGNILSGVFGGVAGSGSVTATLANYKYGGRTFISKLLVGLFILVVLILLHPLVAMLPKVVLSAILIYLSFSIFDLWIFDLIKQFFKAKFNQKRDHAVNIFLVITVTTVMIVIGIFEAVGVGLALSILMFVVRMGKDVIRRQFTGERLRSNVERPESELKLLEKEGKRIRILELEGSLFFGTADNVSEIVSDLLEEGVEYIILDFKRINDIDSTGTHILQQLTKRCKSIDSHLVFSSLDSENSHYETIQKLGNSYENLEDALAWAEDKIIQRFMDLKEYEREISLNEIDALLHLTDEEAETLKGILSRTVYEQGNTVFQEGDSGDKIYFIMMGRAHVLISANKNDKKKRVSTLSKGTIFGEMALIDRKPRSAEVIADKRLICYTLERSKLVSLTREQPKIAFKVMVGVSKELSKRIRIINNMVSQLKN